MHLAGRLVPLLMESIPFPRLISPVLAVVAGALAASLLAACGSSGSSSATAASTAATTEVQHVSGVKDRLAPIDLGDAPRIDEDPAGARLAWQAPDVASTWLPALLAAHVASGRAPRAPQAGLVELHWRLQWLDRAYRSFWRHGGGAAAVIRRALHAVAAPFDGGGAVA